MSERGTMPAAPAVRNEALHTRAAKGGLISGANFALNLALNLAQVPLLLRFWPQETYGLWLSVGALSSLLTSFDGGHQAYVGNLLSRRHVEGRVAFQRTLASAVAVAAITACVQILLAAGIYFSGKASEWLGVETARAAEFGLAVTIYTVGWIGTGSVGAVVVRIFAPTGKYVRSTCWAIGMRVAQFAAVAVAASLGWGLVATTCLFAGTVFAVNVFLFLDIRRLYPEFFPWWRGADRREGLRNLASSGVVTVVGVMDYFSLQGVVLLVSGGLGAAAVPLFTTLRTMANMALQGAGFLLNPIQPDLVRYHVKGEGGKLGAAFGFFWFATGLAINGGVVAGLLVVEPVYAFWTQGKLPFDRPLFAWLAAGVLVRTLASPWQSYLTALNQLPAQMATSLVRASVTVGGVLMLSPRWGLAGVGAALCAAEVAGSLVVAWMFGAKELGKAGGVLAAKTCALALAATLVASGALGVFVWMPGRLVWAGAVGMVLLVAIATAQWAGLSVDVKARALSVVPGLARRCAGRGGNLGAGVLYPKT